MLLVLPLIAPAAITAAAAAAVLAAKGIGHLFPGHTLFGRWARGASGTGLSGAQVEANQFSHDEAQLAYERELQADSTKYQRSVADMKAAGINPMLAAGSSGGSVQSSAPQSASPGPAPATNLGLLFDAAQLDIQSKLADASIEKTNAEIRNIDARTEETGLNIGFFKDTMEIRAVLLGDEHERNQWEKEIGLRGVKVKEDNQRMLEQNAEHYNHMLDEQADLIAEQKLSEDVKRQMYRANAREANMNAAYKAAMAELDKKYREAQTETEKSQMKLLSVEARVKNGIYSPQYIAAICKEAKAEADYKAIMAEYQRGDYHSASESLQKVFHKLEDMSSDSIFYIWGNNAGPQSAARLPGTN